jgi:urease accessory protein
MGMRPIADPDAERPPDVSGLPVLDRVLTQAEAARAAAEPLAEVWLPFEMRSRSRLRARLADGREVALVLPRGTVLRGGAVVEGSGLRVRVLAADEDVVEVSAQDASALARAAYHLGNRHVALQVAGERLVIGYDAVLVDMLIGIGVRTKRCWAPFEPEAGAYAAHH